MAELNEKPMVVELLQRMRDAPSADDFVDHLVSELNTDEAMRERLADELRVLIRATNSTHLLTEAGILSADNIGAGILRRIGQRLAPAPLDPASLEDAIKKALKPGDAQRICTLSEGGVRQVLEVIWQEHNEWEDPRQIASAAVILATRIAGAGLDSRLTERMPELEGWTSPFIQLSRTVDRYASLLAAQEDFHIAAMDAVEAIDACLAQTHYFRAEKHRIGTTLHLSSASLRILQQLDRLRLLVCTTLPEYHLEATAALVQDLLRSFARRLPTVYFVNQKVELLAFLAIGHAAQKGEKYTVDTRDEYWGFGRKSLLGGIIVAVFAILKIHLSHEGLAPVPQAAIYGFNYAMAFVLIYVFGATLATKQPALTASRIAKSLEEGPEFESFAQLVRSIFQSQFMSFVGNIAGAAAFGILLAFGFDMVTGAPIVTAEEALKLGQKLHPLQSGTLFYAGIAGVMLSAAGFIAGFIDNAVVFHRLRERVQSGGGVFSLIPSGLRPLIGEKLMKHSGAIGGNVILGFMLGSAGSLGAIFGLPFDIRHIAFSSTHGALYLVYAPGNLVIEMVLATTAAVLLIGTINFLVSFSITLSIAIYARDLEGIDWRKQLTDLWKLALTEPLRFVFPFRTRAPE